MLVFGHLFATPLFVVCHTLTSSISLDSIALLFLGTAPTPTARHSLAPSLACACIRLGALPAHGQAATMADASVAVDIDQPLDILADLASKIAFHVIVSVNECSQATYLVFSKVLDASIRIDARALQNLVTPGTPDAIYVCQANLDPLFIR
jgi:hypothetical protein